MIDMDCSRPSPSLSFLLLSLLHQALVVRFLAAGLLLLNLVVFPLEATSLPLPGHSLLHEILRPILSVDPRAIPFRRAFNDRPNLRESRDLVLARSLFIMAMGIENGSHLDQLEVALELWSQDCLR